MLSLAFSPDGAVLATASDNVSVDLWDLPRGGLRETLSGHAAAARGLLFRDAATLYSASSDGSIIAWDVRGQRRLGHPFQVGPVARAGAGPRATTGTSTAVAVSPDGSLFATQPGRNTVTLWRASDETVSGELRGPCGEVDSIMFSHDRRLVAATGDARRTVVWNVATRRVVKLLGPAGEGGASGVNFSPDDTLLGTAGTDGVLRIYDVATGRLVGLTPTGGSLQDLDFSPDGRLVAAAGLAGKITIWNVARRTLERTIQRGELFFAIRFAPDGRRIVTGDLTGKVRFWNPATGREAGRALGGQNGPVFSVTYDPSGTQVMTTSGDGNLRLWDVAGGKVIGAPLPAADTGGWGTFFPDGRRVIAVSLSGIGIVWNVDPEVWKAQACRIADRDLTRAEWRDFLPRRDYSRVCA